MFFLFFLLNLDISYATSNNNIVELNFLSSVSSQENPWKIIRFNDSIPPTIFNVRSWDNKVALEAIADSSMAVYSRTLSFDLKKTPYLCWYWRIDKSVEKAIMGSKSGDDYAARIYVTFTNTQSSIFSLTKSTLLGLVGYQTPDVAIDYVWDNKNPINYQLFSPYVSQDSMIVVESGDLKSHQWILEKRNLLADLQKSFGTSDFNISSIGFASDADNTHSQAHAGFADVKFVNNPNLCH
ncbi:MAG: DUF3047 domain-containing protein [Betaproteobacteria bacterium]|nr:DUF3047 domain-containing protein [Betaproteobacteria bacterium]